MKRRQFVKHAVAGGLMPAFLGKFGLQGFGNLQETMLENDNVLVVIQLSGGNDGLNTVVPISQYSRYQNARKNIAIPEEKLLKTALSDEMGIHPAMSELVKLMNEGSASLVQDVGYPNPNFSHFRATDIWNTGSSSDKVIESGWAGRSLSLTHPNYPEGYPSSKYPDPLAIQIGSVVNTSLQGPVYSMGMAITDPNDFYRLLTDDIATVPNTLAGKELAYLRQVAQQTNRYADVIKNAGLKVTTQKDYPNTSLAAQLKIVSRLIAGGLKTKIYFVRIGGFDTHDNQTDATDTTIGSHANLLKSVSDAIGAFQADLKFQKTENKVLGMTYSEFGRRIKSNASNGTDHGAAAPMFFFGKNVNASMIGKAQELPVNATSSDNLVMQHDFRSVYASVLKYWFCMDEAEIKAVTIDNFQQLPIINPSVCGYVTANEPIVKFKTISNFPNPFTDYTTFKFLSEGGYCQVSLFDMSGREVYVPIEGNYPAGEHTEQVATSQLPSGIYIARFQNNAHQEMVRVVRR